MRGLLGLEVAVGVTSNQAYAMRAAAAAATGSCWLCHTAGSASPTAACWCGYLLTQTGKPARPRP